MHFPFYHYTISFNLYKLGCNFVKLHMQYEICCCSSSAFSKRLWSNNTRNRLISVCRVKLVRATTKHRRIDSFDMWNKKCLRIHKNNKLYLVENDVSKQTSFWHQFFIRSFDKGNLIKQWYYIELFWNTSSLKWYDRNIMIRVVPKSNFEGSEGCTREMHFTFQK